MSLSSIVPKDLGFPSATTQRRPSSAWKSHPRPTRTVSPEILPPSACYIGCDRIAGRSLCGSAGGRDSRRSYARFCAVKGTKWASSRMHIPLTNIESLLGQHDDAAAFGRFHPPAKRVVPRRRVAPLSRPRRVRNAPPDDCQV